MIKPRLAVVCTHPIQYHAPLFRRLAERGVLDLHVFYGWTGATGEGTVDYGFGRQVQWDVPLLDGYEFSFHFNRSRAPGTHWFGGLDNPDLVPSVLTWRADAALVIGWAFRTHIRALRELHGRIPVLFRGDSTLLDERPGLRRLLRRHWLRWVYRHVDFALYPGACNRAYLQAHGLAEERLHWAPHAVDNKRFADPLGLHEAEALAWRARLGAGDRDTVFLFAGKLEPKKDPGLLLSAFLALKAPRAHLAIAGSGVFEPALRAHAAGHPRVHFLGFQNQSRMPVVYRLGDVLVLPSRGPGETWGLAVNEAMASARPVLVSDKVGCAPDLVREGANGFVFPAEDPAALGDRLGRLLGDAAFRERMGAMSAKIIDEWSIDAAAASIEDAVLSCVESRTYRPNPISCS